MNTQTQWTLAVKVYKTWLAEGSLTSGVKSYYLSRARQFAKFMNGKRVAKVTPDDFAAFLRTIENEKSRGGALAALRHFSVAMVKEGVLQSNMAKPILLKGGRVIVRDMVEKPAPRAATHDENGKRLTPRQRQFNALVERDGLVCAGCDWKVHHPMHLSVDHQMPRSERVNQDLANLKLLCYACNVRKGNKLTLTGLRTANAAEGRMAPPRLRARRRSRPL